MFFFCQKCPIFLYNRTIEKKTASELPVTSLSYYTGGQGLALVADFRVYKKSQYQVYHVSDGYEMENAGFSRSYVIFINKI